MTNQKKDVKNLIVVLGMHRSGTSTITHGLSVLGVNLGDNLMPKASNNNDKGFWEDLDINKFNIDLLRALGHDWYTLNPITTEELESSIAASFKLRAVELLRKKLKKIQYFGVKDPRICRLLPFWQSIFSHLEIKTSYVIATRNPMSVARSLNKRDGFDFEKSYYLWIDHMLQSIIKTNNETRVVVDYDLLLEDPEFQLLRVAEFLELKIDISNKDLNKYKNEFIESSLRHSKYEEKDLLLEKSAPSMAIDIYKLLLNSARDEIKLDDLENISFIENISKLYKNHLPALNYIQDSENKSIILKEINSNLEEKSAVCNAQLIQSNLINSEKSQQIEDQENKISTYQLQADQHQFEISQLQILAEQIKQK